MSAHEEVRRETERGSSVKLVLNAKREVQIETKAYTDEEPGLLGQASAEAQRVFDDLVAKYTGGVRAAA